MPDGLGGMGSVWLQGQLTPEGIQSIGTDVVTQICWSLWLLE